MPSRLDKTKQVERLQKEQPRRTCFDVMLVERALHARVRAHQSDGNGVQARVLVDSQEEVPPVHFGHHQIEKNETRQLGG